jgi:hypothetical protein
MVCLLAKSCRTSADKYSVALFGKGVIREMTGSELSGNPPFRIAGFLDLVDRPVF